MSNPRKNKGRRIENEVVKLFEGFGWKARRQPLSGSLQDFPHDVRVVSPQLQEFILEVKARARGQGFAQLDRWRGKADMLILRQDHTAPMVYLPLSLLLELATHE